MSKVKKDDYNVGDTAEGGHIIARIVGSSRAFIVFFTPNDCIRWESVDQYMPKYFTKVRAEFDRLNSRIQSTVRWGRAKSLLLESVGRALAVAVHCNNEKEALRNFESVAEKVTNEVGFHCRLYYVVSAWICFDVIGLVALISYKLCTLDIYIDMILGGGLGALGAVLSVSLRSADMEVIDYSTPARQCFQGIARVLLGMLLGLVLVVLIKADLLLGAVANNRYSLAAFSVISGYSERYLPNILERLEKHK